MCVCVGGGGGTTSCIEWSKSVELEVNLRKQNQIDLHGLHLSQKMKPADLVLKTTIDVTTCSEKCFSAKRSVCKIRICLRVFNDALVVVPVITVSLHPLK